MIEQFEELIKKHLSGELNVEDQKLLSTLFRSPECQLYLASRIDKELLDNQIAIEVNDVDGELMLRNLRVRIIESGQREEEDREAQVIPIELNRRKWYRFIAAAASVVLVLATIFYLQKNDVKEEIVQKVPTSKSSSVEHREKNTSGKEKTILLPDSSLVILADQSEFVYNEPFANNRLIHLTGKGYFKVFKDTAHPFTVVSGEITTTALGTEFTVTAFKNSGQVIVRLYEGKVVIKPIDKMNKKMKSEIYLNPGQEFVYGDKNISKNKIYTKGALPTQVLTEESFLDDPLIPEGDKGSWYMFNNQLLSQTFDQLEALYNKRIIYKKGDVKNIYFTGKYERTESLEKILKRIGTINNLKVTKNDTAFIISK